MQIKKHNGAINIILPDSITLEEMRSYMSDINDFISSNFLDEDIVDRYYATTTTPVGLFWYFVKNDDIILPKCISIEWTKTNIRKCIDDVRAYSNFHCLAHDDVGSDLMKLPLSSLINLYDNENN